MFEQITASKSDSELWIVGGGGGVGNGKIRSGLQILTKAEYEEWKKDKKIIMYPQIHITKTNDQWVVGLAAAEVQGVSAESEILPALLEAKFIFESSEREFARLTKIEPENIQANPRIKELFEQITASKSDSELWIVGGGGGVQYEKIAVGLQILTKAEYEEWKKDRVISIYPQIHITKINDQWVVGLGAAEVQGISAESEILPALLEAKFIFESSEREFARLTNIEPENIQANPRIKKLFAEISASKSDTELWIVGGSGGVSNGMICGGLQILTRAEYVAWKNDKNRKWYPQIHITKTNDQWIVSLSEVQVQACKAASRILYALLDAELVYGSLEREFERLTKIEPENIRANPRIKVLFEQITASKQDTELWIVGGVGGVRNEKIASGLQILTKVEYEEWKNGKKLEQYPQIHITKINDKWFVCMGNTEAQGTSAKSKILPALVDAKLIFESEEREVR